ncbi:hypothetical protein ES705_00019 [subsurface metagenome]|nr:hypothetical protein [Clostridia bacterium]
MRKSILVITALFLTFLFIFTGCQYLAYKEMATEKESITEESAETEETADKISKETPDTTPQEKSEQEKIVEDADPSKGEYFVNAILKSIDSNKITVEQLVNDPDETVISPEVTLSKDCKIIKHILDIDEGKEAITEIALDSIKLGSEIGIIFKSDNTARAIIYQELAE